MSSDTEKLEYLYKKSFGYPNAYPGVRMYSESAGNARPRIIPSLQIFSQPIPPVAPSDLTADLSFDPAYGVRYTSSLSPHIVKYEKLLLKAVKPQYTFWYAGASEATPGENLLANAIPPAYDKRTDTYIVELYVTISGEEVKRGIEDYQNPWTFDYDAGYVYFVNPIPEGATLRLTVWRYEGAFGLGGGLTGGTGPQGSTGPVGISGTNSWTPVLVNVAQSNSGSTFTRSGGSADTWDSRVYSREGYSRGVSMAARRSAATANPGRCAFGLNSDPGTAGDHTTLDYGFYLSGNLAYIQIGEQTPINPVNISSNPTLYIIYDGQQVRFYMNADLLYATVRPIDVPLYLDMRLFSADISVENVVYGPMGEAGPTGPQGVTGPQGSTGPAGAITTIEFDGGTPYTVYDVAPGLDCGGVE